MRSKAAAQLHNKSALGARLPHNHNSPVILTIIKQLLENLFIHSCRSVKTLFYFGLQSSISASISELHNIRAYKKL